MNAVWIFLAIIGITMLLALVGNMFLLIKQVTRLADSLEMIKKVSVLQFSKDKEPSLEKAGFSDTKWPRQ